MLNTLSLISTFTTDTTITTSSDFFQPLLYGKHCGNPQQLYEVGHIIEDDKTGTDRG